MVTRKTRKVKKLRGNHTHGWGSKKKHRGAGSRGGRGMAGTGKRGDAKKPSIWSNKKYFGKYGFTRRTFVKKIQPVNLSYFEINADKLLEKKLIEKKGDVYIIDVKKLGFDKVLGCGKLTRKCRITAPVFSKKSAERIKKAGGEAIQLNKTERKAVQLNRTEKKGVQLNRTNGAK
jgi:large subunit ribosomal protein L15